MSKSSKAAIAALSIFVASQASAQDNIIYGGFGSKSDNVLDDNSTPFAVGLLRLSETSNMVFGIDIAGEGTKLDSTWGGNNLDQALSVNLLIGGNMFKQPKMRIDGAVILGFRETFSDCPDSFIGYQCYADTPPETEYGLNYGALVTMSLEQFTIGVRATGESTQVIAGIRF
jgi:hypothetical protein